MQLGLLTSVSGECIRHNVWLPGYEVLAQFAKRLEMGKTEDQKFNIKQKYICFILFKVLNIKAETPPKL